MTDSHMISSKEMARRAGISLRQLDTWTKKGRVTPAVDHGGSGHPRRWNESQIGEVIEVKETMRLVRLYRTGGTSGASDELITELAVTLKQINAAIYRLESELSDA